MRPHRLLFAALLAALAALGCNDEILEVYEVCLLTGDPTPAVATPGTTVVLTGGPLSIDFDTVVRVGGIPATDVAVLRDGCTPCNACRAESECGTCGECEDCSADCDVCIETLTFTVPEGVPAGAAPIVVFNQHGTSGPIPFEVLAAEDSDASDIDTADSDSDAADSDATDTDPDTDTADTDPDTDTADSDTDTP